MRIVFVLLLGIVIGTLATVSISNAIAQRNPVPRAVMVMMAYHQGQLQRALQGGQCSPAQIQPGLAQMRAAAADIQPLFKGFDQGFSLAAQQLQQSLQQAAASGAASCRAWQAPLAAVKASCNACHRQYR